jgi:hypothetical protein
MRSRYRKQPSNRRIYRDVTIVSVEAAVTGYKQVT